MDKPKIVISGLSGRLPESNNIQEFRDNLYNGVDMVTDDGRRWPPGLYGLPTRNGKLKELDKFDAEFFGIAPKQAENMDPQLRILLEVTYEAIADAGINPSSIRGTKTGVFVGSIGSDAQVAWGMDPETTAGYVLTGCSQSMLSNRLSYFFDFKGPSFTMDTACSSSLLALDNAVSAIRAGRCDSAIVAGCNLDLRPQVSLQFQRLNMLSQDGKCASFDADGNGYVRSEAIVAVYLQSADSARRLYAEVVHSKNNSDGHKENGITYPSGEVQKRLLKEVYSECGVDPSSVVYVEAHGTGTAAGDPQEVNAIADVFCGIDRKTPLLIGSTKSNMGHPEPAAGLAALAKVLISMEEGLIPANLHYKTPNPSIPGLTDGRLKVVDTNLPFSGGYVGVNSFGFGGSNVHVVLKNHGIQNKGHDVITTPGYDKERLVTLCAHTVEGLHTMMDYVQKNKCSLELQALLQNNVVQSKAHQYRGYTLLKSGVHQYEPQNPGDYTKEVWFAFSGMGSQWPGMARDLMDIDVFRMSLEKSGVALKQHGVDLIRLIMNGTEETFRSTVNSFVCIAAIEVALVDTLNHLGIQPDGIVGHSVGEVGCAYADGGLTAEETVLVAYWRGRCIEDAKLPAGGMAAVGMTWDEAIARCPDGVVPACHNAHDTITISGPKEKVTEFVHELKQDDIFAKEVDSSGVAFHSPVMAQIGPPLLEKLKEVIKAKRPRTSKWISSSIPEESWSTDLAAYSSAEYHVNNLVSPVLFQEAANHIPKNAIVIEIGPHCILQAILKRALQPESIRVGLLRKECDNREYFLSSLGKLFNAGVDFDIMRLYPNISFPVPRGTPMISPLLRWDHSKSWRVPTVDDFILEKGGASSTSHSFTIDTSTDSENRYLLDHTLDGRVVFPGAGYLVLVWKTLAQFKGVHFEQLPVVMEDIHIHQATVIPDTSPITLHVHIHPGTSQFEIDSDSGDLIVSGKVNELSDASALRAHADDGSFRSSSMAPNNVNETLQMNRQEIYQELQLRGYEYGEEFQILSAVDSRATHGYLQWTDKWISFLDGMLQLGILGKDGYLLPTRIHSISIDPNAHLKAKPASQKYAATFDSTMDKVTSGSITIKGIKATAAPRRDNFKEPITQVYEFVPFDQTIDISDGKQYLEECKDLLKDKLVAAKDTNPICGTLLKILEHHRDDNETYHNGHISQKGDHANRNKTNKTKTQSTPDNDQDDETLRSFIKSINVSDPVADPMKPIYSDLLVKDKVLGCLRQQTVLRSCLQTAIENAYSRYAFKVVEYGSGQFYKQMLPWLQSQPSLPTKYFVVASNETQKNDIDTTPVGVSTCQWDGEGDLPSAALNADLMIVNDAVIDDDSLHRMALISNSIKEGSFALLHGATNSHGLAILVDALFNSKTPHGTKNKIESHIAKGTQYGTEEIIQKIKNLGFAMVSHNASLLNSMFLYRKLGEESGKSPKTVDVSRPDFKWVEEIKQGIDKDEIVWIQSSNPKSGILGLVACLRKELHGENARSIIKDDARLSIKTIERQKRLDLVVNVYQNGRWGHYMNSSLAKGQKHETEHAYLDVLTRGDLSSLQWIESPLKHFNQKRNTVYTLCDVSYAALNFRDVMLASGKLPPDAIPETKEKDKCLLGMEFSGFDNKGKRFMAILPAKALATSVAVNRRFLWTVPKTWSLQEAASVPVAYSTAFYALIVRGKIRKGDVVLIHSASGAVGQAAIAIALQVGCRVYATVGSQEKRDYLKQRFPQLNERNFANSRDISFENHIMHETNGHGCDVILNSLADDKLQASLRCLAMHGRFLELGKYDLARNTPLGMALFLKNTTFHGILLDSLFTNDNPEWMEVYDLFEKGLKTGIIKPLKSTVFEKDEAESAFRFMAQGKHIGKCLIKIRDDTHRGPKLTMQAMAKTYCDPYKSYIVTGGLGGFGLQLTQWLIDRGARTVVLTSRSGVRTGYQERCLLKWNAMDGVHVKVATNSIDNYDQMKQLIKQTSKTAPIGGIFHLAMVLDDNIIQDQTAKSFQKVCQPKMQGIENLDKTTRKLCKKKDLKWFVAFSSIAALLGNQGQTNYGFANSYMERICEQRVKDGLPGLAIQWGAIGDVGVVSRNYKKEAEVIGTQQQPISSCLASLDVLLSQPMKHPVISCYVLPDDEEKDDGKKVAQCGTVDEIEKLKNDIAHILGISDAKSVNPELTFGDIGIDSLMSVEVKQLLDRTLDTPISMKDIRQLTFKQLENLMNCNTTTASNEAVALSKGEPTDYHMLMPEKPVIKMESASGVVAEPLFLLHPIEGSVEPMREVVGRIKGDVFGLQYTTEAPSTSIEDLASYYIKLIKDIQPNGPYRLAGYSYGATVCVEMTRQLLKTDTIKSITLIEGSPQHFAASSSRYRHIYTGANSIDSFLIFVNRFTPMDRDKLEDILRPLPDIQSKVHQCVQIIKPHSTEKEQIMCEKAEIAMFNKVTMMEKYVQSPVGPKVDSDIFLIKAAQPLPGTEQLDEYLGMNQIFTNVQVRTLPGDHGSIITGEAARQIAVIINENMC